MGVFGSGCIPFLRQDSQADLSRPKAGARTRSVDAIPGRDCRPREETRPFAPAASAVVRVRRSTCRPIPRPPPQRARGARRMRAEACDVDGPCGRPPLGKRTRGTRRSRSSARGRVARTRRVGACGVFPMARVATTVLFALRIRRSGKPRHRHPQDSSRRRDLVHFRQHGVRRRCRERARSVKFQGWTFRRLRRNGAAV